MSGRIILITGVMAAGKSTVAELVANRLEKSVHLRGDTFRKMIVNGRLDMSADAGDEALEQLMLRYRAAVNVAQLYAASGFDIVYQDVIIGSVLEKVLGMFDTVEPALIVLNPRSDIIGARESQRTKKGYAHFSVADLKHVFDRETPRIGTWIDSSDQTAQETADQILLTVFKNGSS